MPRIYSNYTQNDYDTINALSKELGFSLSAFQHYCVMLYANPKGNSKTINTLSTQMFNTLAQKQKNDTFIVSSLIPKEWPMLSRSDKMLLAKQLSKHIKANPSQYDIYKTAKGQTTIYIKL